MIPQVVHVCWDDKTVLDHPSPLIQLGLKNLQTLNPDWTINIYNEQEVDQYLASKLSTGDLNLLSGTHIVERSDLWRLLKLYYEGGVYTDIDRFCNVAFSDILKEDTKWVLPTQGEFDFSQDFMMTEPGNPAFGLAIEMVLERRQAGNKNTYYLGPQTYMHAVTKALCGREINTNPGVDVFTEIRQTIQQHPFIITYRENGPLDTVIYRHGEPGLNFEQLKRQFYKESGVVHWTEA